MLSCTDAAAALDLDAITACIQHFFDDFRRCPMPIMSRKKSRTRFDEIRIGLYGTFAGLLYLLHSKGICFKDNHDLGFVLMAKNGCDG